MDSGKKARLYKFQNEIVKDLDVIYIIDELLSRQAITSEDYDYIQNDLKRRSDRTKYLLTALAQKGSNKSYDVFVESLSKDYSWLSDKFNVEEMKEPGISDSFEDILSRGDVPRLPEHYVHRSMQEKEIASRLKDLARHQILALIGMSGSGKSSLATGVLRSNPDLVVEHFGGVVFWLNMGDVKTDDDIFALQSRLHRKASAMFRRESSYMNSSISMSSFGSNLDNHSLSSSEYATQDLKDALKEDFLEPTLKDALLVLDEVNKRRFVEAFDIGCKILVTVRDTNVVSNFQAQFVNIQNNLQVSESLQLFASCLNVDVTSLPSQAKKLHEICKGGPFYIALIGAQLAEDKERLLDDTRHWNYYIDKLRKRRLIPLNSEQFNPTKAILMCLNSLPPRVLELFKKLAVLPDNVKVSDVVISVLWNKSITEVRDIMKQLKSKSLILKIYAPEQKKYLYEIHELIMETLRSFFNLEEMKKLHADVLKSYKYGDLNDISVELCDDGYIAFYIGYHIRHTGNINNEWTLFNRLYMDLKFLGNKVRLTGPADAIMDLQLYENEICKNDIDRELLVNIKEFLATHGNDLFRYPCTDIVQSILQHVSEGILHMKAYSIARANSNRYLYFNFLHEQNFQEIKYITIDVNEIVSTVCFLGDNVIVGTANAIKIFHVYTNKLRKELPHTAGRITWLATCPRNPLYLAAFSEQGVLQVWYIDDLDQESDNDTIEEESDVMENYEQHESHVKITPKLGLLLGCRWANIEENLITHTAQTIIVYRPDGSTIKRIDKLEDNATIISCLLSNDDKHIITGCVRETTYFVDIMKLATKEKIMRFDFEGPIINILNVPGQNNSILVMNENNIVMHEWTIYNSQNKRNICKSKTIITSREVKDKLSFLSAVINRSGSLLFVSTDDSRIICIDLDSNTYAFDLDNRRGNVVSMAVSEVSYDDFVLGPDVLLSGTGTIENSVKVWYLETSYVGHAKQKHRKVRLTTKFDASFINASPSPSTPHGHAGHALSAGEQSTGSTPRRHQSFVHAQDVEKRAAKKTLSLDRHSLKPLNLKGISNGEDTTGLQPLLAVVDDKNNIQIMRGRKLLTEIITKMNDIITVVKISPCNQYIIFGLQNGLVKKYSVRTKECTEIMDVNSPVQYLNFVNAYLLVVFGKNKRLMAYKLPYEGDWKLDMLQAGNSQLGSQEILNDIQGLKKIIPSTNNHPDALSNAGSEVSASSKDQRLFPAIDNNHVSEESRLVQCFWVEGVGMLTVESNAMIKLWDLDLKLRKVLNARQMDTFVNCAVFQKNYLAICDDYGKFQIFTLKESTDEEVSLQTLHERNLNNRIVSCDLTNDGSILAMGLDSGSVVLWSIPGKCQIVYLQHHKTKVQSCSFSPVPDKSYGSNAVQSLAAEPDDERTPLVLVTMATEIVWWNITRLLRPSRGSWSGKRDVLSPTPNSVACRSPVSTGGESMQPISNCVFFSNDPLHMYGSWETLWRSKTGKEGFKKKEILACIKLSGMNAKKLCYDDKFSCFVTVDNPGHVHIMNIIKPKCA